MIFVPLKPRTKSPPMYGQRLRLIDRSAIGK